MQKTAEQNCVKHLASTKTLIVLCVDEIGVSTETVQPRTIHKAIPFANQAKSQNQRLHLWASPSTDVLSRCVDADFFSSSLFLTKPSTFEPSKWTLIVSAVLKSAGVVARTKPHSLLDLPTHGNRPELDGTDLTHCSSNEQRIVILDEVRKSQFP